MTVKDLDSLEASAVFAYKHYIEDMIVEVARPYGNDAPDALVIVVIDYQGEALSNVVLSTLQEVVAYMTDQEQNNLTEEGRAEWYAFRDAQIAEWRETEDVR